MPKSCERAECDVKIDKREKGKQARVYFDGTGGSGRVGGGPGQGGRFCVDMLRSLQRMAIDAVLED